MATRTPSHSRGLLRTSGVALLLAALCGVAGCKDTYPLPELPGSCSKGQKACYTHPQDGREILLKCNDGSMKASVWIVDTVCVEGEVCDKDACAPVG